MCVITERGEQCLRDWGRWAAADPTIKQIGYRGCSAEQMAGHVSGGGNYEENPVAELVDKVIRGLLEERKRLVARFYYVDRLSHKATAESVGATVGIVRADISVIQSAVGGVVMWTQ